MSKRSREKHSTPEYVATDSSNYDEQICEECGFFEKAPNRDVREECAAMECRAE